VTSRVFSRQKMYIIQLLLSFGHLSSLSGVDRSGPVNWLLNLNIFFWLFLEGKIVTWDSLQRRGWSGPGFCILCCRDMETITHLLFDCQFSHAMWSNLKEHFKFSVS